MARKNSLFRRRQGDAEQLMERSERPARGAGRGPRRGEAPRSRSGSPLL